MGKIVSIDNRLQPIKSAGEPPMETHLEKYLDARFDGLEGKLDAHLAAIDQRFNRIEDDIKEIRSGIKGIRSWYIGTTMVVIAILIALFTYHAQVMQSQMSVFAEYVKAVTQTQK